MVSINQSPIDVWVLHEGDILRKVMGTEPIKFTQSAEKIDDELAKAIQEDNKDRISELEKMRSRISMSIIFENFRVEEWNKYVDSLEDKKNDLDKLIKAIKEEHSRNNAT